MQRNEVICCLSTYMYKCTNCNVDCALQKVLRHKLQIQDLLAKEAKVLTTASLCHLLTLCSKTLPWSEHSMRFGASRMMMT